MIDANKSFGRKQVSEAQPARKADYLAVNGWDDMRLLGVNSLTGEACAYSQRTLVDLNEDGLELVIAFLGLPYDTKFMPNTNGHVAGKPAVASMMLAYGMMYPLARFALARMGAVAIAEKGAFGLTGIFTQSLAEHFQKEISDHLHVQGWALEWVHTPPGPRVDDRMLPAL